MEIIELDKTASKGWSYDRLDEWQDPVYKLIHARLKKYKFVNGGAAMGIKQPVDAEFWWGIYAVMSHVCYSVNMETEVVRHHASAWERSQALIKDIEDIIEFKSTETILA